MKDYKDIKTFDELLDHEYGPIGTEPQNRVDFFINQLRTLTTTRHKAGFRATPSAVQRIKFSVP